MKKHEELKWFLIQKFILLLVIVGIVEYVIFVWVDSAVMPVITGYFFPYAMERLSLNGFELLAVLILVILACILLGIQSLLPPAAAQALQWLGERLDWLIRKLIPSAGEEAGVLRMDSGHRALFLIFLFVTVFVMVLPFMIGAFVYARIVTREFAKIQEMQEEANREYDRKRNLMLSDIAHDLRTPITTVSGYAAALSDGMVAPDKQQEYLDAIRSKSARMNDLITLLFDYVKLDSDGFALKLSPLDLCELARENAALLYSDIEEAHMELVIDIPEERIEVDADRLQLSRVITNLLVNAVRHNRQGTQIMLYVRRDEERILAAVADTGACIPDELAEQLFEPFARGDKSRSGAGSGLGLSIAHKVVQMHGWELLLVQQPGLQKIDGLGRCAKAFVIRIGISEKMRNIDS